jgi:nucleotide-binding universal stress UspA family protein
MTAVTGAQSWWPRPAAGGRVVVGIDDSPDGLAALRWAIRLARSRGARLVAVRAWALGLPRHGGLRHQGVLQHRGGGRGPVVFTFRGAVPSRAAMNLTRRAFHYAAGDVPDDLEVTIETPEGNPGPVLTQIASGSDDVLVVGTRPGPRLRRLVHGSVSAYCTAHARCPVTVVTTGQVPASSSGQQGRGQRLLTSPATPNAPLAPHPGEGRARLGPSRRRVDRCFQ